jgi:pimeloyl-ACP methyl ester carboxylesterase
MEIFMLLLLILLFLNTASLAHEQVITLFVHGIADSHTQADPFKTVMSDVYTLDFDCSRQETYWPLNMICYCSLGQDNELEHMYHEWQKLNERFPQADGFILIGVSRGASIIINFLARYKPENIKAVVLESPFDTIENVVDYRAQRYGIKDFVQTWIPDIVKTYTPEWVALKNLAPLMFWQFSHDGIQPGKVIHEITQDIPMLFVTVENDHSVPVSSTHNLMQARFANGHKNMHHLHLMQGRHGKLLKGPEAERYQQALHSFFAQYDLPHNAELVITNPYL